jgi:hypothetical protein
MLVGGSFPFLGGGRSIQLSYADVLVMVHQALEACKHFLIIAVQTPCGKGQIDQTDNGLMNRLLGHAGQRKL